MICAKCNKSIARPLELHNGDWACPHCKKVLGIKSISVNVTAENDETFKLSELCYVRTLKRQSDKNSYAGDLERAVEYCRSAARMGNPKALVRLGYYYEHGYISADTYESFRLANDYYRLVWSSTIAVDYTTDDADYADGCKRVKVIAARRYLELIKKMPDSVRTSVALDYREEVQKINDKGIAAGVDIVGDEIMEEDRISHIFGVLQACFRDERSPLFGLLRLEAGEFAALCETDESTSGKKTNKLVNIAKKVVIVLFDIDSGTFKTIKTLNDCSAVAKDSPQYLYFFNEHGAHSISDRKCAKIGKALKRRNSLGEYAGVKNIIEAIGASMARRDCIFGVDDVLMYKSGLKSYSHATEDLVTSFVKKSAR